MKLSDLVILDLSFLNQRSTFQKIEALNELSFKQLTLLNIVNLSKNLDTRI